MFQATFSDILKKLGKPSILYSLYNFILVLYLKIESSSGSCSLQNGYGIKKSINKANDPRRINKVGRGSRRK